MQPDPASEPLFATRSLGRGWRECERARRYIGCRIHRRGDDIGGTITEVTATGNGYAMFVVAWDDGAPDWWATEVSPRSDQIEVFHA